MNKELAMAVMKSMSEVQAALGRLEQTVEDEHIYDTTQKERLHIFRMGKTVCSLYQAKQAVIDAMICFGNAHDIAYSDVKPAAPALHFNGGNGNGK